MPDDARTLAWWSRAQLDELGSMVQRAWLHWAQGWLPDSPSAEVEVEIQSAMAHEMVWAAESWAPLGLRDGAAAWLQVSGDAVNAMQHALFGPDQHGQVIRRDSGTSIAGALATGAWTALSDSLRSALCLDADPDQSEPDRMLFKPWSGCVRLSVSGFDRMPIALLLNVDCARALLRPTTVQASPLAPSPRQARSALFPVSEAMADLKLVLRAELAECQLDLGSLQGLRIGDIVPLPHSLDAPLMVSTSDHTRVCMAFLGRNASFKAIELVREHSPGQEAQADQLLLREA